MKPFAVKLHAYDLSNGLASMLFANSEPPITAIWHSCIEINGNEYFFQNRIVKSKTFVSYGQPHRVENIGSTDLTEEMIDEIFMSFYDQYNEQTYNVLSNNCNHFADKFAKEICGVGIPSDILNLPEIVQQNTTFKNLFGRFFGGFGG